ncbi:ATP-binding protein [Polaromonas sp. JS666]|uniref:ATP-binding protein n=1 Tax=Polaromonas sp. (strain JS666 / ATCC BAA-500) TaxID=296591 RepID=UPI0000531DDA|nr:ATP-binding protein [Polaromonas sp. JS666]ABE43748.1 PAS/PAC sensor hybrid histidine kinase [Polaromonas sp. JS666]
MPSAEPSPVASPAPPAHILIAEDSGVQAYMLRRLLEEEGYATSVAKNGRLALELAARIRPSLLVSDVNMPEMSGYELCRQIKANPDLCHIPVILVTNLSDPDDVLLGLKSGADSFVIKPYDRTHMLARVQHALSNQHLRSTAEEGPGVEISFHGEKHQITASRAQILNLLMSTYETTAQRNRELHESREELAKRTTELLAANRFLDSIIENIPNMIFIKDAAELKFVRLNRAGENLLGYSRDQLLGKSDHDFFPKNESDHFVAREREVLASGKVLEIAEEPVQTANKGIRLLRTKKVAVLGENGLATHLLGISEDITQQKEMEKEILNLNAILKARAEELEASHKSLESFTSAATHDLRSPLSIIGGYAGLLEKNYASRLDEKGQRYVSIIRDNIKGMAKLIDDLLAFSKLGQREISKASVNMHGLAQQVIEELLQRHPEGSKPRVVLESLPPAQADASLLRQVWVNLLSNAVKYSSRTPNPLIEISGRIDGAEAVYSVRDNGAGFSMDHYDKLFEIFQRLHTDEEFEGNGVGLPIVQRVVTRHGGRVWAEGKVGQGAVFHFALPV